MRFTKLQRAADYIFRRTIWRSLNFITGRRDAFLKSLYTLAAATVAIVERRRFYTISQGEDSPATIILALRGDKGVVEAFYIFIR